MSGSGKRDCKLTFRLIRPHRARQEDLDGLGQAFLISCTCMIRSIAAMRHWMPDASITGNHSRLEQTCPWCGLVPFLRLMP